MVHVEITRKDAFRVIGAKTWIGGETDNSAFAAFWESSHEDGTIDLIRSHRKRGASVTNSDMIGLSCTENDPNVREFFFYVCAETDAQQPASGLEIREVGSYLWAIFSTEGTDIDALMECEIYAWKEWLPGNGAYEHDNGPEMEVYPAADRIEYWIPIRRAQANATGGR
jgi:predicted transcriptional regulator YdeE